MSLQGYFAAAEAFWLTKPKAADANEYENKRTAELARIARYVPQVASDRSDDERAMERRTAEAHKAVARAERERADEIKASLERPHGPPAHMWLAQRSHLDKR